MPVELTTTPRPDSPEALSALFVEVGWKPRSTDDLRRALSESDVAVYAYSGDRLVGFGRIFGDRAFYSWVVDLIVAPSFQKQGIGRTLLERLVAQSRTQRVFLVASDDVAAFYEKTGWTRSDSAVFTCFNANSRSASSPTPPSA